MPSCHYLPNHYEQQQPSVRVAKVTVVTTYQNTMTNNRRRAQETHQQVVTTYQNTMTNNTNLNASAYISVVTTYQNTMTNNGARSKGNTN